MAELKTTKKYLELNQTVFYVALVFLATGVLSNFLQNLDRFLLSDIILYGISLVLFVLMVFLIRWKLLETGLALIIAFAVSASFFTIGTILSNVYSPDFRFSWVANPQIPLILCLFGAVSGIAVDKRAALGFGILCIGVEVWYALAFRNGRFYREQLPLNIFTVSGAVLLIWYYRTKLEFLVCQLDLRLDSVRVLKEKADAVNTQNKPFVVFGRNTVGLMEDFTRDVDMVAQDLQVLRRSATQQDTEQVLNRLGRSMDMVNHRMELVKYIASASPQRQSEIIRLEILVDAALYPFRILPEYRENLAFQVAVEANLQVFGLRRWFLQLLEYLVTAACGGGATRILLKVRSAENREQGGLDVVMDFRANGRNWRLADPEGNYPGDNLRIQLAPVISAISGQLLDFRIDETGLKSSLSLGSKLLSGLN